MTQLSHFGMHRSVEPKNVLAPSAWRLDNTTDIRPDEILIDAETIDIDASTFRQFVAESGGSAAAIGDAVLKLVNERGKLHHPVTEAGGILIGRVARIGEALRSQVPFSEGERIVTLASLAWMPLSLSIIHRVHADIGQVDVEGQAVLFPGSQYTTIPDDLPGRLVLGVLNVAGAPAMTPRIVREGDSVVVIGCGKSGLLCLHEVTHAARCASQVIAVDRSAEVCRLVEALNLADTAVCVDAGNPLALHREIDRLTSGMLADTVINVVTAPGTEGGSILATRDGGTVYFYSTATSFSEAALQAEGLRKEVRMVIGSRYTKGWVNLTLDILRTNTALRQHLEQRYEVENEDSRLEIQD